MPVTRAEDTLEQRSSSGDRGVVQTIASAALIGAGAIPLEYNAIGCHRLYFHQTQEHQKFLGL